MDELIGNFIKLISNYNVRGVITVKKVIIIYGGGRKYSKYRGRKKKSGRRWR